MSKLFSSSKRRNSGSAIKIQNHYYKNNDNACFQVIDQIAPISVDTKPGNQLLITLSIPDTWCDKAGDGGWFAISVNNEIKGRGVYYSGKDGQRVPITIQTVLDANSNQHFTIKAMWCNENGTEGRACYIGEYSEAVLTVLLLN